VPLATFAPRPTSQVHKEQGNEWPRFYLASRCPELYTYLGTGRIEQSRKRSAFCGPSADGERVGRVPERDPFVLEARIRRAPRPLTVRKNVALAALSDLRPHRRPGLKICIKRRAEGGRCFIRPTGDAALAPRGGTSAPR